MESKGGKNLLPGHWVHSHEEDTDEESVFRPATFNFPRSRGRSSFELKPGGGLVEQHPGPTDRPEETEGSWKLEDDQTLSFFGKSSRKPLKVLRVVSVSKDRLVLKK
jgi:hypothetical protein